jgi:hypothetical protein
MKVGIGHLRSRGLISAESREPQLTTGALFYADNSAYISRIGRADERTRTADLTSLRVMHQALQGFAQACKSPISKPLCFLWPAACCTVLRSRWCQSGVNIALMFA